MKQNQKIIANSKTVSILCLVIFYLHSRVKNNAGAKNPFGRSVPTDATFVSHQTRGLSKGKAKRRLLRTSPSAMRKSVLSQVKKEEGDHPVCRELATENRGNLFFKRSDALTKQDTAPWGVRGDKPEQKNNVLFQIDFFLRTHTLFNNRKAVAGMCTCGN